MKLLDICEAIVDCPHSTAKNDGTGYPLIRTPNVGKGRLKLAGVHRVSENVYNLRNERAVPQVDDLILAREAPVGNVAIIRQGQQVCLGQRTVLIRPNKECVDPDFLVYYLLSPKLQHNLLSSANGATVSHLNMSSIRSLEVQVPDIEVQKRIGAILARIDDKIELNTAINENLEQQAQALFKAWFVDFEPFGGVMPDDWQIVPLDELCDSISKKHRFNKPELIFLNTGDVENGMVLHNNYSEVSQMPGQAKKSIAINDILYSEIRPINKHFTYVNFNADDYVVSTKLMVLRAKGISPRRLYQFLTMPDTLNELQHEAETRSGTFPQIRFDNIQQLEMIVASEQIENEYSERLNTIYSMIDSNNAENQRLAALRDTLLPKLMNGEIDVSEVKI